MNHHEHGLSIRRRRGAPYATAMGDDQASEHVAALIMVMKMGHHAVLLLPVCTAITFVMFEVRPANASTHFNDAVGQE